MVYDHCRYLLVLPITENCASNKSLFQNSVSPFANRILNFIVQQLPMSILLSLLHSVLQRWLQPFSVILLWSAFTISYSRTIFICMATSPSQVANSPCLWCCCWLIYFDITKTEDFQFVEVGSAESRTSFLPDLVFVCILLTLHKYSWKSLPLPSSFSSIYLRKKGRLASVIFFASEFISIYQVSSSTLCRYFFCTISLLLTLLFPLWCSLLFGWLNPFPLSS